MRVLLILTFIVNISFAQIANNSFFPNMRSINPGVSHLRKTNFLSLEKSKTDIDKHMDIQTGGILSGVNTDVELDKTTFFAAGKLSFIGLEVLADNETGETVEGFETNSYERTTTTNGSSSVISAVIDLGFIGVMLAKADYSYDYDFNVGEVPTLNRYSHKKELQYNLMRLGTAFKLNRISIGAFYSIQSAKGDVKSILYDPTSGNPASPENSDLEYKTLAYGLGVGYVNRVLHMELSLEKITDQELKQSNTYLYDEDDPTEGQRLSAIIEARVGKISLGARVRKIEGGFADLEQLISSNMLYQNANESQERIETAFNFSYGASKGLSLSGFYSQSNSEGKEESDLLDNGEKYDTSINVQSYGVSVSYTF